MLDQSYEKVPVELKPLRANVFSLVFSVVFFLAALLFYGSGRAISFSVDISDVLLFFLLMIAGIIVHEALHGIGFWCGGKSAWKDLRFGVVWSKLIVFASCVKPISVAHYRFAAVLPAIALGLIPFLLAYFAQSLFWYLWGSFMIIGSCGDFIILWTLRRYKKGTLIADSPDRIGYDAYILRERTV
ncbi:DUF3267 domain-containing protein [Brevibacillus fluminis]|uniref:DUF3267 domain-containing protein n=1 Tax=Brevibacillus fluminis TaxID=511487 RepID=UPI003F896EBD